MKIYQPLSINNTGGRGNQEDSINPPLGTATVDDRTFIVCDGMGGHEAGEVASGAVCEAISAHLKNTDPETFDLSTLKDAIDAAYRLLAERDNSTGQKRMGTTLTLVHLSDRQAVMAHIGDSRIYHLRPDGNGGMTIMYKSSDHSLVNELVRAGVITPEEAVNHPKKNVITRAMQAREEHRDGPTVHITNDVAADDRFFQCSDGVLECVTDNALCEIMADESLTDEQRMARITEICRSSHDNFSAYYVHVKEGITAARLSTETVELRVDDPGPVVEAVMTDAPESGGVSGLSGVKPTGIPAPEMAVEVVDVASPMPSTDSSLSAAPIRKSSNKGLWIMIAVLAAALCAVVGYMLYVPASEDKTAPAAIDSMENKVYPVAEEPETDGDDREEEGYDDAPAFPQQNGTHSRGKVTLKYGKGSNPNGKAAGNPRGQQHSAGQLTDTDGGDKTYGTKTSSERQKSTSDTEAKISGSSSKSGQKQKENNNQEE